MGPDNEDDDVDVIGYDRTQTAEDHTKTMMMQETQIKTQENTTRTNDYIATTPGRENLGMTSKAMAHSEERIIEGNDISR